LHRETANDGLGIGRERRFPLRRMFGVAPASPVAGDVSCGALLEVHRLRGVEAPLQSLSTPTLDWVNPVVALKTEGSRSIACLGEPMVCNGPTPIQRGRPFSMNRNTQFLVPLCVTRR